MAPPAIGRGRRRYSRARCSTSRPISRASVSTDARTSAELHRAHVVGDSVREPRSPARHPGVARARGPRAKARGRPPRRLLLRAEHAAEGGARGARRADVELFLARVRGGRAPRTTAPAYPSAPAGSQVDGTRWHADVGFGHGTLLEPIPFGPGGEHEQSGWRYRVVEDGPELVLQSTDAHGEWIDLYGFVPEPVPLIDVVTSNWYTCTHPRSPFVTGLIVTAQRADGTRESLSDWSGDLALTEETPPQRHHHRGRAGRGPGDDPGTLRARGRGCLTRASPSPSPARPEPSGSG